MARFHLIYLDIDTGYYPGVNHGLASLAAAVRSREHALSFHHLSLKEPEDAVVRRAKEEVPDIVGFSYTSPQRKYVPQYAAALKTSLGKMQLAGGVHPTIDPEEVSSLGLFSGVAVGEAEFSLPELLDRVDQGQDLSSVPGFWLQKEDGSWNRNPVPPLEADISRLPLPDYSIFDTSCIGQASAWWVALMLTRGCPYNCAYCCNHVLRKIYPNRKDYVRLPDINHAISIIEHGLNFYREVKGINFADDLLIFNEAWFGEFAHLYKQKIGLPYTCNGRVEHFSDTTITALKTSGCVTVHLGVESGSEWLRRNILNRRPSNQQITECFQKLRKAEIPTFSYNIVGFPMETRKHMEETLDLNHQLRPNMGTVFYFYPFPGTKLFNICQEYDLLLPDDMSSSGYLERPSIKDEHCKLADCRKVYQKIRLFLASRALATSLGLPRFLEAIINSFANVFPGFFVNLITKRSGLKSKVRKWLYKRAFH